MLMALFSLPVDLSVAFLTSLLSLGRLTIPLTGPLIDPLIAPLMPSVSGSVVIGGVGLAGDQDCRCFLFCVFFCVVSFCDCMTDRRNRFADSRETASLNLVVRFFWEASVYEGGSGLPALRSLIRIRPPGVRRGLKKSNPGRLRESRCDWGS